MSLPEAFSCLILSNCIGLPLAQLWKGALGPPKCFCAKAKVFGNKITKAFRPKFGLVNVESPRQLGTSVGFQHSENAAVKFNENKFSSQSCHC